MPQVHLYAILLTALMVAGCAPPNPRKAISGKVTLKDAQLDEGVIEFRPLEASSSGGPPATTAGSVIAEGAYSIEAEAGLVPGKYKVMISSANSKLPDNEDEIPGPSGNFVMKDRIPPEFNTRSKLTVEVTEQGENKFDFDIP
ncbi:hypothetical protein [Aureliella helgolandensis]|uniref:Carboxypeptidase regulatory-like domain-containing protein n=1 Tax=Aureliella helgolandensis TaxID=2527968 RepID=A0A518GG35_9BACT|nr:hypothetical protein [Aureliella helgolandensis]QDV27549.1 hypothetical protein Q31a_59380 [Aureliella helgolandensis]